MSHFEAKIHQIRLRLGLRPIPGWGAYSAHPDFLAGFKGPYTYKGRKGERGERKGGVRERDGSGEERRKEEEKVCFVGFGGDGVTPLSILTLLQTSRLNVTLQFCDQIIFPTDFPLCVG